MPDDDRIPAKQEIDRAIGAMLRTLRVERKISQATLGAALGITSQQIQKYERGINRIAGSSFILLEQALGIKADILLEAGRHESFPVRHSDDSALRELTLLFHQLLSYERLAILAGARELARGRAA